MKRLQVIGNIFTEAEMGEIAKEAKENWNRKRDPLWMELRELEKVNTTMGKVAKKIYEVIDANWEFKVNIKSGLEIWININKRHGLHYDCDEALRQLTGLMKYPILSSVYYLKVPTSGGELVLFTNACNKSVNDIYDRKEKSTELGKPKRVKAEINNLVIFESKVPHYVDSWASDQIRISIAANLWIDRPTNPAKPFSTMIKMLKAANRETKTNEGDDEIIWKDSNVTKDDD